MRANASKRRGLNYRQAVGVVRPDLARQLVEPVEATLCKNQDTKPPMPGTALAKERNQ